MFGTIEAGGTKFVCAVGTGPDDIHSVTRFPTTTPGETLGRAIAFFGEHAKTEPLSAIGVACFGPVDLDPASPTFGFITTTPKRGWAHTDVAGALNRALGVPVALDTDVNGAALAEYRWGAGRSKDPCVYITIGTGIGAGLVVNGRTVHGLIHPEAGHIRIPRDRHGDTYPGNCPYHGDCFEGLASGPAMKARWGQPAETLRPDHPGWDVEARTIALALVNLICILSPRCIILGGGVMQNGLIFPKVRAETKRLLNGYLQSPVLLSEMEEYIVPPGLGAQSGILGGIALAEAL